MTGTTEDPTLDGQQDERPSSRLKVLPSIAALAGVDLDRLIYFAERDWERDPTDPAQVKRLEAAEAKRQRRAVRNRTR